MGLSYVVPSFTPALGPGSTQGNVPRYAGTLGMGSAVLNQDRLDQSLGIQGHRAGPASAAWSRVQPQGQWCGALTPGSPDPQAGWHLPTLLWLWEDCGARSHRAMCHQEGTLRAGLLGKLAAGLILAPWGGCHADPVKLFWKAVGLGAASGAWISGSRPAGLAANPAGGFCRRTEHSLGVRHLESPPCTSGGAAPRNGHLHSYLLRAVTEDSERTSGEAT